MRPLLNNPNEFWSNAKRIQRFPEGVILNLSQDEVKKCRFKIINHSTGDAECYVHNGFHGVRLFPKHMWDIRDGQIYIKDSSGKWREWYPDVKENLTRFEKEE